MFKIDLVMSKKKLSKLNCYEQQWGSFELTIAENTLNLSPKEHHIYTAWCITCKKAMAVKAKELLSFERVFGTYEIVTTKSTFDKLFD
jgi:hypothetical protein